MLLYDKVIHLVPEYPPIVGGVADFSAIIKVSMEEWGIPQEVIVAGIKPYKTSQETTIFVSKKSDELRRLITSKAGHKTLLVLHYVCYGYSLKGIPFFLPVVIRQIKKDKNITILTYFHELYATHVSPLKSAFWLGPLQKKIAQKLAHLSDHRITTSMAYKAELDHWCEETKDQNHYMPVFSNIPESTDAENWNKKDQLVIFGSRGSRNKVYCEVERIEYLIKKTAHFNWVDIGQNVMCNPRIEKKGVLSAEEISVVLRESKFGLINYENMPIEKSGVFAAYAANGVVPIVFNCNESESVYESGTHYVSYSNSLDIPHIPIKEIQQNLYKKYMETASVSAHIKIVNKLLTN